MPIETPAETLALLDYIAKSPTPFHCAAETARILDEAGFTALAEGDRWELALEGAYYLQKDGSIVAFQVGRKAPADGGFRLVGAHTDSPNLRVKPQPDVGKAGYRQLGVEIYGGALEYTWLDRDLGLAGRVVLAGEARPSALEQRLVDIRRPILRVPSLAIHLNREVKQDGLKINSQKHMPPVLGLAEEGDDKDQIGALRQLLAAELGVAPERILSWDLSLADIVPPAVGGLNGEFVFAPRLDNQASSHAAVAALLRAREQGPSDATRVVSLYDHEECGSSSTTGAAGALTEMVLRRVAAIGAEGGDADAFARAIAKSVQVSADMAHAIHPSHADRHEPEHRPALNGGPVIKVNVNQRYATAGDGAALFEALCREAEVPVQKYVNRTDLPCGTTIGPISAARLGIMTVDVGNPMLSMHSIREQAGVLDHPRMIKVLAHFMA
ncbi:MAG: M18 family aminopeptidase [Deltaproteobacteria bacterium]|nr:MAG: M18 family aminopeptidase [Deltaproteobacteria bacterium]